MKGKFFVLLGLTAAMVGLCLYRKRSQAPWLVTASQAGIALFGRWASAFRRQILLKGALSALLVSALQWLGQKAYQTATCR